MEPESLDSVCRFSASDEHRANNLADRLAEDGIEASLLYDSDSVTLAVLSSEADVARRIAERFLVGYDDELEAFVSRNLKPTLGRRLWGATYTVLIPLLLAWYSASSLWKALTVPNTQATPYLSSWRATDLGIGIIGLAVAVVYLASIIIVRRRIENGEL